MSLTADRATFQQILSGIEGVKGHKYRPSAMRDGDAWPMLESLDDPEATAFVATWRILVVLPPDEVRASEWFSDHHELISDALADVGYVDRIEPGLIVTEAGDLQAMFLTVRKEA